MAREIITSHYGRPYDFSVRMSPDVTWKSDYFISPLIWAGNTDLYSGIKIKWDK